MARLEVLAPASPTTIDDAFMTDMRRHFTDAELVELIMLGRLHRTFGAAPMGPRSHAVLEPGVRPMTSISRSLSAALAILLAFTLGAAGAVFAFDGEPALHEAAKKEKEFTWYTAHYNTETAAALCQGFEKKYPGVKCNYIRTTAQVAYQRLAQDQKAGIAQCSVISSTDQSHYTRMKKDGWLQAYKPKNLSELVDAFRSFNDPDDQFVATAAGLVLITYNTSVVSPTEAPKKWMDLTDPKWKGKVSIGHPGFSGYVGTWVVEMKKLYGWDFFKKLEQNKPRIGRSINDTVTMLNAKESIVAAGPAATTLESKARGNPLAVVYPEDGAILMVSASGILKNAPAPNAARLFIEYLLSREGNEVMVQQYQDPVNRNVKPMAGARLLTDVKTIRPSATEIEKGIPEVKELFRETFGI